MRPTFVLILLSSFAAASCASQRASFRPVEATKNGAAEVAGAYYEMVVGDRNWGDVKIWSSGAFDPKGDQGPVINVGMRIRNDSNEPLQLVPDKTQVEIFTEGERMVVLSRPLRVEGEASVPASSIGRLEIWYDLPDGVEPGELSSFEVVWAVQTPAGLYTQATPFTKQEDQSRAGGYWAPVFWGPWWYPYSPFSPYPYGY